MDEIEVIPTFFRIGDVDDPDIYAAHPIWEWEQTDQGRWCRDHCLGTMTYTIGMDPTYMGYRVNIHAKFRRQDYTYFLLKWGKKNVN